MRRSLIVTLLAGAALLLPPAAQSATSGSAASDLSSIGLVRPFLAPSQAPATALSKATRPNPVTAARAATRQYRSFVNAKKAGYGLLKDSAGIACISKPGKGGMGIHFVNVDLVGTPRVSLKHPEALVYARENGHRRLVALEYVVLKQDWEKAHGANAHRPWLYGQRFNLTHAGNRYGLPAFYSLHAWIWKDNPAGRFMMWNPDVHCSCCP